MSDLKAWCKTQHMVVSGNIGVGKTTFCKELTEKYELSLFDEPHKKNPYWEDFYQNMKEYSFRAQIWFITERYGMYTDALDQPTEGVVHDRILFEDFVFAASLHKSKLMDDRDFSTYNRLYNAFIKRLKKPDFVIYLYAPPAVCLQRIQERGLEAEKSITVDYLQGLDEQYDVYLRIMACHTRVFRVNWEAFRSPDEVLERIRPMLAITPATGEFSVEPLNAIK